MSIAEAPQAPTSNPHPAAVTTLPAFMAYAEAFEVGFASRDWKPVDDLVTDDVVWSLDNLPSPIGGTHVGRRDVIDAIRTTTDSFDRRFDRREPRILEGPREIPGGIHMTWAVTYSRDGLEPFVLLGEEWDFFRDGKLSLHRETLHNIDAMWEYLGRHAEELLPVARAGRASREMIAAIAKAMYRRGLRSLERGDLDALLASFADDCVLTFVGDTPLGARLAGRPDIRPWFERFRRLLPNPRFDVQKVVVTGPLWKQQLAAHVKIHSSIDGEPYTNEFAHFLVLRWGKVVEDLILEDTQRWERACRRLVEAGVAEAAAGPMTGRDTEGLRNAA